MLVDVFWAIVYLRPLTRHYHKIHAFSRVTCNNCLRGHRLAVLIAKYHAFPKICSELLVVFFKLSMIDWFIGCPSRPGRMAINTGPPTSSFPEIKLFLTRIASPSTDK
jgi:hypothetical protein